MEEITDSVKTHRHILAKALLAELLVSVLAALALFLPVGTLFWWPGWIFLVMFFGFVAVLAIYLSRSNPPLLAERITLMKADEPVWDKIWLAGFYILSVLWLLLMSLDAVHEHWELLPSWLLLVGVVLLLCSLAMIFLVVRVNTFLSPTVRLQQGHEVISTGLYSIVRHPLYASACLFYAAVPLILGSGIGLTLGVSLFPVLLVVRTLSEEKFLREELVGYEAYMAKVRYRFLPRIW